MDLGLEIQKTNVGINQHNVGINQHPQDTMRVNFQVKQTTLTFRSRLPKNGFCGRNFKNLSPDSESALLRYYLWQLSVKMDNFEFFGLNLGKLPNYVRYFGSNNVEGVAESWLEAEMSWMEVDGAGWRLI